MRDAAVLLGGIGCVLGAYAASVYRHPWAALLLFVVGFGLCLDLFHRSARGE
jgi:hypothetical protein